MSTCNRKHVVITGSASGIGEATMLAAAAAGWHVYAGDRGGENPEADASENVTRLEIDVTNPDQIARAAQEVSEHVGPAGLQGLANVAGIGVPGPMEVIDLANLRLAFEVDVFGQVAMTQAFLPLLRAGDGRVVFIGSVGDRASVPFFGALTAAKAAIAMISETFRQELAPWGIKVILVEPGLITTGADVATKKMIENLKDSFTPQQNELYGDTFAAASDAGFAAQSKGSAPDGVAATVMKAFTSKHPKNHYLTGKMSHLVAASADLPSTAQDALKRKQFHLPEPGSKS